MNKKDHIPAPPGVLFTWKWGGDVGKKTGRGEETLDITEGFFLLEVVGSK